MINNLEENFLTVIVLHEFCFVSAANNKKNSLL